MTIKEEACLYALFAAPGIGRVQTGRMLDACGCAADIFTRPSRAAFAVDRRYRSAFLAYCDRISPQEEYARIRERGIHFAAMPMETYPEKLRTIPDPPFGITWIGRLPDPKIPAVSVIGARQCSGYGRQMAARFGTELAAAGVQVISGMAVGIDGLAQSSAIEAGGSSFAVLGSGADICYPSQNRDLYEKLKVNGGILSEHPPGTQPKPNHFPMRNRLISAFCNILLVVEARRRSGTLITVDMALEQGRDIFALPGRVTDALSDGCHQLIRQGAGIATCGADLLEALYGTGGPAHACGQNAETGSDRMPAFGQPTLSALEQQIVDAMDIRPQNVAQLAELLAAQGQRTGIPTLTETLVDLCIRGVIRQENGGFVRPCA